MRLLPGLVAAALLLAVALPSVAAAAPAWLPARVADAGVSDETLTGDVDPVFDRDGTMLVVTDRNDNGQATTFPFAYVRPPGGAFGRTLLVDDDVQIDIAQDPRGGLAVVWGEGTDLKIRRRPEGGSFGPVETVAAGIDDFAPEMEIGPDGRETFLLREGYVKDMNTGHSRLVIRTRPGPGAALGAEQVITSNDLDSEDGRAGTHLLAVGPSGAAVVAYEFQATYPDSFDPSLTVRRRGAADATFGTPQVLATAAAGPDVGGLELDAAGRPTIAFASVLSGERRARIANGPANIGAFAPSVPVSPGAAGNPNHNLIDLDVAPDGSAAVGFGGGGTQDRWAGRRGPSPANPSLPAAPFDVLTQVDGGFASPDIPEVAIAGDGAAYAVVISGNVFASDVDGWRSAGPGQAFARTRIAEDAAGGDAGEAGIGSEGNAVVLYKGELDDDGQRTLMAVPFDSEAPTLGLTGPGSLVVGVAGLFTASPFDYWGPVTTTIAHDDGGAGTPHAYGSAGTHTATATSTDLAGFSAQASVQTAVVPAPPSPPPPARPAARRPAAVKASQVIRLPSARRCVSRRRFTIRLRRPNGLRLTSARVTVDGKVKRTVRGRNLKSTVDLRGLPRGRFVVRITVVTSTGRKLVAKRTYRTCAPKKRARRAR